jgi:hypothetical protein
MERGEQGQLTGDMESVCVCDRMNNAKYDGWEWSIYNCEKKNKQEYGRIQMNQNIIHLLIIQKPKKIHPGKTLLCQEDNRRII